MNHKKPIIPAGKGGSNYYLIFSIMEYEGIPILFIARDDFNTLYLCDCVEFRDFQRWTISMTNTAEWLLSLLRMLRMVMTLPLTMMP